MDVGLLIKIGWVSLVAGLALLAPGEGRGGEEAKKSVLLVRGATILGMPEGIAEDGRIRISTDEGSRMFRLEEIRRIDGGAAPGDQGKGDRLILSGGGRITGEFREDDGNAVRFVASSGGTLTVARSSIDRLLFQGEMAGIAPEKRESDAVVVGSAVVSCAIVSVSKESVKAVVEGRTETYPRGEVRALFYRRSEEEYRGAGWFARVTLANRDTVIGVLDVIGPERVALLVRGIGRMTFDFRSVVRIQFGERHAVENGNILVGGSGFIREYDVTGREVASAISTEHVFYATRIDDRLLISGYVDGRPKVYERDDKGARVWEYDQGLSHPIYVERGDDGRTVIVDYGSHRVVEVNEKKETLWEYSSSFSPMCAERMANGNLLVSGRGRIEEVDRAKQVVWKSSLTGELYPHRAHILENGNILVVGNGVVAEVTREASSKVVWKIDGLSSSTDAVMLSDGTVAIAEQGGARVTIRTTDGKIVREITGLSSMTCISRN